MRAGSKSSREIEESRKAHSQRPQRRLDQELTNAIANIRSAFRDVTA